MLLSGSNSLLGKGSFVQGQAVQAPARVPISSVGRRSAKALPVQATVQTGE